MAVKPTPQDRLLGSVKAGKYLTRVKGYPTPIVANPGGGQANAVLCDADMNYIGTVANNGDSLMLPPTEVGREITLLMDSSVTHNAQVFGNPQDTSSGTINGTAGTTGIVMPFGTPLIFYCPKPGVWLTK